MSSTCKGHALLPLFLAMSLILGGCAIAPPGEPGPEPRDPRIDQAETALAGGDIATAAAQLEQAARDATGPSQPLLYLRAARLYAQLGRPTRGRILSDHAAGADGPRVRWLRALVQAELALAGGDTAGASGHLPTVPEDAPEWLRAAALDTQARVLLASDQPLQAARRLHQRAALLSAPTAQTINRQRLWDALVAVPMPELAAEVPPLRPDRFGGWLELAYVIRSHRLDAAATAAGVTQWRGRYPEHPAAGEFSRTLVEQARQALAPPARVALLLPLSGELASVGGAVRQGFLAAYYAAPPAQRPVLRVYDLGENGSDSLEAYRDAVENGMDLVIGPLTKPQLERLAVWGDFPVPVLALNTLEHTPPQLDHLFQFGLSPEDDARAVAALAMQRGHERAVVLTPRGEWGTRVADAFTTRYRELGGTVLESAGYDATASDFSSVLRPLFNLDASQRRYQQLRRVLQRNVDYTPRRRQDVQAIFIGAFPREARLIRPQIRFHHGIGLPVYATSHVWTGRADPVANEDMDGIVFVDIPWIIDNLDAETPSPQAYRLSTTVWPQASARLPRLHALGVDAYRLAALVDVLALEPGLSIDGVTGTLRVDNANIVHRHPRPAEFRDGRVHALPSMVKPGTPVTAAPSSAAADRPAAGTGADTALQPATGSGE